MNRKDTALFLCALVLSTLAHEHAHHRSPIVQNRIPLGIGPIVLPSTTTTTTTTTESSRIPWGHGPIRLPTTTTTTESSSTHPDDATTLAPSNTTYIPTGPTTTLAPTGHAGGIEIRINATLEVIVVANTSAGVAAVVDAEANVAAVVNLTRNSIVLVNLTDNRTLSIASGFNVTLTTELLGNLSLSQVWAIVVRSGGVAGEATEAVLQEVAVVLVLLDLGAAALITASGALAVLVHLSQGLVIVVRAARGLLVLTGGVVVTYYEVLKLADVVTQVNSTVNALIVGGVAALIQYGVTVNVTAILSTRSAVEFLIVIVRSVSARVALSKVLHLEVSSSAVYVFGLIANLSVGIRSGCLSGFLGSLVVVLNQTSNSNVEVFVEVLTSFAVSFGRSGQVNETISALFLLNKSLNSTSLTTTIVDLRSGSLTIGGIKVSSVLSVFFQLGSTRTVDVIVSAILAVQSRVSVSLSSVYFFVLLIRLVQRGSLSILGSLGASLSTQITITTIIHAVIQFLLRIQLLADPLESLRVIPVIGTIVVEFATSLQRQSNGNFTLLACFRASEALHVLAEFALSLKGSSITVPLIPVPIPLPIPHIPIPVIPPVSFDKAHHHVHGEKHHLHEKHHHLEHHDKHHHSHEKHQQVHEKHHNA